MTGASGGATPRSAPDFAACWGAAAATDPARRADAEVDLAFWRRHAAVYDLAGGQPAPEVSRVLASLAGPGARVVDIGCGTGRFAIALAARGCRVTGLDHSPDMLARARHAAASARVRIDFRQASWPPTDGLAWDDGPYDLAVAAWSLYRQTDLRAALLAMARLAPTIVTVDALGVPGSCAERLTEALGRPLRRRDARATMLHGAMVQLGLVAGIEAVRDERVRSLDEILRDVAEEPTEAERARARAVLQLYALGGDRFRDVWTVGVVVGRLPELSARAARTAAAEGAALS